MEQLEELNIQNRNLMQPTGDGSTLLITEPYTPFYAELYGVFPTPEKSPRFTEKDLLNRINADDNAGGYARFFFADLSFREIIPSSKPLNSATNRSIIKTVVIDRLLV